MSHRNTKTPTKTPDQRFELVMSHVALGAMALATVLSAVNVSDHREAKVHAVLQPAYTLAGDQGGAHDDSFSSHRRMEELRHEHATYGSLMRTHPTTGSL